MKHYIQSSLLFMAICAIGFFAISYIGSSEQLEEQHEEEEGKFSKRDRIDLAWKQELEMTLDPELGYVPRERLLKAFEYKQQLLSRTLGKAAITGVNWVERGPKNCGGRTRSILIDLNDPSRKTVWAGSVSGGLWKTTDITLANPNWTNQNDFFDNMAITGIAQATGNTQVMYFCTGEGNGNIDAVRGLGVWKSINGGSTWTQLSSTNNSNFYYCQKVFPIGNGDTVLVAAQTGLYQSVNGGTSFTKVLGTSISGALGNEAEDIEQAANGTLYASMSGSAATSGTIHKSFNNGTTWTTARTINGGINKREIELALSNNDTNTIWGLVEANSTIRAIIRSTNAGLSFDTVAAYPNDADPGISDRDFSRTQAWYDLSIAVDPNNSNVCFVGGIDLFKTTNGGASWQQVSHWYGGFGFQEVHADQHTAIFEPGNSSVMYFGNDGGIYRSTNATASIPTITPKEVNYNTTQFYAADIHPTSGSNHFLAGAQDNGSHRFSAAGINSTTEVTGGDGAFCHIDQNQPTFQFTSYVYNNYYRSTNTGSSFSSTGLSFGDFGRFINPSDYDDTLNIMYAAHNGGTFFKWSNPQSGTTNSTVTVTAFNSSQVSAVKTSPNIVGRVYFGTGGGRLVRVDNAHTASGTVAGTHINTGVAGMPTSYLSNIEIEDGNDDHIVITYSNFGVASIWETRNGGINWSNVEGNLPDMPIRWALMNPRRPHQILLATELGVWSTDSLNGAATNWQPSNSGLSNTRVDMLKLRKSDFMVIAATHGRGVFSSNVFTSSNPSFNVGFTANKTVTYPNAAIQFTSTSVGATSYLWNFGDGTTSTLANPSKTYSTNGYYTVTLTINGGANTLTINNYIKILPYRGVPYTASNGGNFDVNVQDFAALNVGGTPFELGASAISGKSGTFSGSNAWVTSISSNYVDFSEAYLLSPNFNCTAPGNYTITFYSKYKVENTWDGFRIEYSTNNGNSWLPLGTTTATNWYNYANPNADRPFPQNQAFFSSNAVMASFVQSSFTTNAFAGQSSVCFRFAFKSDNTQVDAGIAIDNFELLGPPNGALPVTMGLFKASRLDAKQAKVIWSTIQEKNNKGFEVYRKLPQDNTFAVIGFVQGKGNSSINVDYEFIDAEAGETEAIYQLKQIDFDGKTSWSNQVFIPPYINKADGQKLVIIAPSGNKIFNLTTTDGVLSGAWIYDSRGRLIQKLPLESSQQQVDLNHLPDGIYFLHVTQAGKQQVVKVPVF
jgi:hypothetical protein